MSKGNMNQGSEFSKVKGKENSEDKSETPNKSPKLTKKTNFNKKKK